MIDYISAAAFGAFLMGFVYFPALFLLKNPDRGPASSCAVCMEQVRSTWYNTNAHLSRLNKLATVYCMQIMNNLVGYSWEDYPLLD